MNYSITTNPFNTQYGWICPKCGRVLSPSTTFCPFCSGSKESYTTDTSIVKKDDNTVTLPYITGYSNDINLELSDYHKWLHEQMKKSTESVSRDNMVKTGDPICDRWATTTTSTNTSNATSKL